MLNLYNVVIFQARVKPQTRVYGVTILSQRTIRLLMIVIFNQRYGPWVLATHGDAVLTLRGLRTSTVEMLGRYLSISKFIKPHVLTMKFFCTFFLKKVTYNAYMKLVTLSPIHSIIKLFKYSRVNVLVYFHLLLFIV